MKTWRGKSSIESVAIGKTEAADVGCSFCRDAEPEALLRITHSRNGYQARSFEICRACRTDLSAHFGTA